MFKGLNSYFTALEKALWYSSMALIVAAYFVFDGENVLTLLASLIGVTSLILCAKGNPLGQLLMVVFSIIYGIISYSCAYYGEMVTYLGMTMPMALFALITWLKNPYNGNRAEVKVGSLCRGEPIFIALSTSAITALFYFILRSFGTASIALSTASVATSFLAVYLTFRRSAYYALAYAANDMVLVALWVMASVRDIRYVSVVVCFSAFFVNDIYGYISWQRMKRRQHMNDARRA